MSEPNLTPAEDLLMEVLIARTRLGEPWWTFEYRQRPTLNRLVAKGLITIEAAVTPHLEAHLTPLARDIYLSYPYVPNGAKVEWGVQTADDAKPVHYVIRSSDSGEHYHRAFAARNDGALFKRATVVMPWTQVPLAET